MKDLGRVFGCVEGGFSVANIGWTFCVKRIIFFLGSVCEFVL